VRLGLERNPLLYLLHTSFHPPRVVGPFSARPRLSRHGLRAGDLVARGRAGLFPFLTTSLLFPPSLTRPPPFLSDAKIYRSPESSVDFVHKPRPPSPSSHFASGPHDLFCPINESLQSSNPSLIERDVVDSFPSRDIPLRDPLPWELFLPPLRRISSSLEEGVDPLLTGPNFSPPFPSLSSRRVVFFVRYLSPSILGLSPSRKVVFARSYSRRFSRVRNPRFSGSLSWSLAVHQQEDGSFFRLLPLGPLSGIPPRFLPIQEILLEILRARPLKFSFRCNTHFVQRLARCCRSPRFFSLLFLRELQISG